MAKSTDKKDTAAKPNTAKKISSKKESPNATSTVKTVKAVAAKEAKVSKKKSASSFAKATFEDKMSQAIKESIANRKENNRVYDEAIITTLKKIIANYTESPELLEGIEKNTDEDFLQQLNIDSVDFVEIIVDAEESFKIKLEDDKIKSLRSFDDLYDLIEAQIKASKKSK